MCLGSGRPRAAAEEPSADSGEAAGRPSVYDSEGAKEAQEQERARAARQREVQRKIAQKAGLSAEEWAARMRQTLADDDERKKSCDCGKPSLAQPNYR